MPEDVKFSISLPDGRQTEWDQKQYNKAAKSLYEKYPDAQVNRISGYSDQSELTPDSSFHITLDDGRETDWNYDQFSKAGKSLMEKYPGAKISVSDDITARRNRDFAHQYEFAQDKIADSTLTANEKVQYQDFIGKNSSRYDTIKDRFGRHEADAATPAEEDTEPVTNYVERLKQNAKRMWGDILYGVGELMDINSRSYTGPSKVDSDLAEAALSTLEEREKNGEKALQLEDLLKKDTSSMSPEEKEEYNRAIDVERYLALRSGASKDTESAKELLKRELEGDTRAKEIKEKGAKIQDENSQEGKGIAAKAADLTYLAGSGIAAVGATLLGQPELGAVIGNAAFGSFAASSAGSAMRAARDAGATDEQTVAAGTTSAAIMFLVGRIPFFKFMGKAGGVASTKAAQATAEALSNPAVREAVQAETQKLTKEAAEALGMTASHYAKQILSHTASSSATFAAMNGMSSLVPLIYENPKEYPVLNQVAKSVAEGAIDGAIMGALFGGINSGSEFITRRNHYRNQMAKNGGIVAAAMDLSKGEAKVWDNKANQFVEVDTPPEGGWGEILGVEKAGAGVDSPNIRVLFNGKVYSVKPDAISRETVTLFKPKDLDAESRDAYASQGREQGQEADTPLLQGRIRQEKDYLDRKVQYEESNGGVTEATQLDVERNNAALEARRDAALSEIVRKLDNQQFWKAYSNPDHSVTNYVDLVEFQDGSQGYVVSESDDRTTMAIITESGKRFLKYGDPQITKIDRIDLDEYLDSVVSGQDSAAESARMSSEQADNLVAVQERLTQEGGLNVGTEEAPVIGSLVDVDLTPSGGAYLQVDGEDATRFVPWNEVASALNMPLDAKTDVQISEDRFSGEVKAREYNKTLPLGTEIEVPLGEGELPAKYKFKEAVIGEDGNLLLNVIDEDSGREVSITEEMALQGNLGEIIETLRNPSPASEMTPVAQEEPIQEEAPQEEDNTLRDFRGNPIPLKDDGSVNQTALWNADPEAWARWNDDTRQDGGANSRGYIAKAKEKLQSDAKTIQKQIDKELDFDRISQLEGQLGQINARIADLERIENNYASAEAAQAKAVETPAEVTGPAAETIEAAPIAEATSEMQEESVPQTPDQVLEAIFADINSRLAEAKTPEEREALMQEKRQALEDYYAITTTDPTIVGTRADILQRMEEAGCPSFITEAVRDQLKKPNQLIEGFRAHGFIFIVADNVGNAKRARLSHFHEHWHNVTRVKGYAREFVSRIKIGVDYLLNTVNEMAGVENGYDEYLEYPNPEEALADEVISLSMEIIADSTSENVDENLRKAGLDNEEIINFVKTIYDGERRNDQEVPLARRGPANDDNLSEENQRQDGRDSSAQPEGDVVSSGSGVEGNGGEGIGTGGSEEEVGPFGRIFRQFVGKAKEAIRALIQNQGGEAIGALSHPDIGPIDLVWGEEGTNKSDGFGLAKLVKYHPEVVENLQEILNDMSIISRSDNRINLESDRYKAAVRLTWDNQRKTWLLTAFEKKNSVLDNTTDTGETLAGERNDTATPQDTVSENKDSEIPEETNTSEEKTLTNAQKGAIDFIEGDGSVFRITRLDNKGIAANGEEVRFSVRYSPQEREIGRIAQDIADQIGVSVDEAERWVRSETSLAAIITGQSAFLDYEGDDRYTAIKQDTDYPQGTVDFNNICQKRLAFTEMYQRVQKAFPNTIITGEDLATIRNIMKEHDLMVACGLCYVEDRRQLLGEIAKDFVDNVRSGFSIYESRGGETKKKNAQKFRNLIGEDRKDDLSIYDLITLEGSAKLLQEHPGLYQAFQAFNNARGQQSGNLFQGYAEYKREILKWNKKKVKSVNDNGGLRVFSYSDFEAHHLIDLVQIIQDCARKGVKIQGYTKVPAFARAVANTGLKLNRSLIPLGDTGIVDGKLAYDSVEGIDINDPNFLPSNDNVGNILIGINDEQIRLAMADPFIHFIIPYHSNQKDILRSMKQTGAWTNYKLSQTEKDANGKTAEHVNIYTDVLNAAEAEGTPITTERQFTEKFLAVCKERGLTPRFAQFLDQNENGDYVYTPGYYKFLVDFKLFDEQGRILPQEPVRAEFDDAFNAEILNNYIKEETAKLGENLDDVYNEIVDKLGLEKRDPDIRFRKVNATQKQPASEAAEPVVTEEDVMFRLSKNNKATVESWLKKREDLNDEQRAEVIDYIDKLDDAKTQLATAKWFANGTIRIPEDMKKVEQAISVAGKAKVDPLRYNSPMELLEAHAEFKPKEDRINPDEVSTLHRAAEYPDQGIVVYDVDNTKESRENMRKIINTHFGEDASPWCLLQGDGKGNLTPDSQRYWRHYNAYPKQVAFKDGKLLAFSANDKKTRLWWDRKDESHYGIPITKKMEGDELGRSISHIISDSGELIPEPGAHPFRGNRQNGVYEEWNASGDVLLERTNFKDGKTEGLSETWFPSGQIQTRKTLKDDMYVGTYEAWYDNGNPRSRMELDDEGRNNGPRTLWYRNGNKQEESNYVHGQKVGDDIRYYESGEPHNIVHYNDEGDIIGTEDYADFGNSRKHHIGLWRRVTYAPGDSKRRTVEEFNGNGHLHKKEEYHGSKWDGTSEFYYPDGTLQSRTHYVEGTRHGLKEVYHENGRPWLRGDFKDGEVDGIQEQWNKEGDLILREEWKDGQKVRTLPLDDSEVMFRKTYHGSGADFVKFDHSHMGEGEGNQAYGWGTYVSTNEDTGRHYAEAYGEEGNRHLYTVDIPNDNGENYIHWDKPITRRQSTKIMNAVRELADKESFGDEFENELKGALGYGTYGRHVEGGLNYMLGNMMNYATGVDEGAERNAKVLSSAGIVGIEIPIDRQGGQRYEGSNFVIFDENNLEITDHIRFRKANQTQNGFISNAEMALDNIKMDKATPEQWIKMLEKNGGLKAGEDKWLGLSDWLKESDKKTLTKEEVANFIAENRIQIEEQKYSERVDLYQQAIDNVKETIGRGKDLNELQDEINEIIESEEYIGLVGRTIDDDVIIDVMSDRYGDDFQMGYDVFNGKIEYGVDPYSIDEDEVNQQAEVRKIDSVRLGYTTEGLENRAEIALTVPTIDPWNENDKIHFGDAGEGRAVAWIRFGDAMVSEERSKATEEYHEFYSSMQNKYGMGWENKMTAEEKERAKEVDAGVNNTEGGQRVLVIDEIQSKRHQEGREKGYKKELTDAEEEEIENAGKEYKALTDPMKEKYGAGIVNPGNFMGWPEVTEEDRETMKRAEAIRQRVEDLRANQREGIPAAPFEKNWHELAMKRMLRLAAEEGYDKIAWTTGDQQAERYNLGTVAREIKAEESYRDDAFKDIYVNGEHIASVNQNGDALGGEYAGKNLSEIVGKEIAVKLMEEGEVSLSGNDLRIGGEGMKGFYDDILPRFMNKYGKKWGVKVQDIELPEVYDETGRPLVMHSIDVTPEMKESVMEGQVMFRKATTNTKDGKTISYESMGGLPAETKRTSLVERTYRKTGAFSFTGKEKIESAADVAYIFKELETEAVENSFIVFVKDGKPTILHTGIGDISSTTIDSAPMVVGMKDFAPDEVYMVHNHPSGRVEASRADWKELEKLQKIAGETPVQGVIIDTVTGEYGVFDTEYGGTLALTDERKHDESENIPLEVLSFNKMVFSDEYKAEIKGRRMTSASEVAAYLSAHRLGEGSKVGALLVDRKGMVTGNLVFNGNYIDKDNARDFAEDAADAAIRSGAEQVILFGDFDYSRGPLSDFRQALSDLSGGVIRLTDVVKVDGNHTRSLAEGTLRDEEDFWAGQLSDQEKSAIRNKPVTNVEVDSGKVKLPTNRKEAIDIVGKMSKPFVNIDQGKEFVLSNTDIKHIATQDNSHQKIDVKCLGVVDQIIKNAVKIGNDKVPAEEVGHTRAVEIYYCPVKIDSQQYSARLVVKEYENRGVVLDDLHLYDIAAKERKPVAVSRGTGTKALTPSSASGSGYKVKDLIHSTKINDQKLLGLTGGFLFDSATETDEYGDAEVRFRKVTDPATLERLNSEPTIKVYRAMQEIDGKLYPPMAAKVEGKMQEPIELGVWEEAVERPDLADAKGKFNLNKGNGKSLKARYNPYIHTSRSPLNDQFSSAYDRPNLVTVEVEVPESELTSGYKAEKAKDAVGEMTWHSGPVSGKLPEGKKRKVILSRWDRPLRIVPDSEVAERIAELLEGENLSIPYNTVTPSLREELEKRGVQISDTPSGNVKGADSQENVRFRKSQELVTRSREGGLAGVIGDENASELYRNVYRAVPKEIREQILGRAGNDLVFSDATKGAIAEAIEKGDKTGIAGLAANMLRDYVGDLDERTARYILWRGDRKVEDDDLLDTVNDIAMQRRLQVGEFADPIRFRLADNIEENQNRADSMADDAKATLDEKKEAARKDDALTTIKAMSLQKEYDRKTVNTITVLAKNIIKDQDIDSLNRREIARLLSIVTTTVGKAPKTMKKNADALVGMIVDHLLKSEETKLGKLASRKATKVNQAGVEVQGELDVRGQNILKAYKAGLDMRIDNPDDETDNNTIRGRLAVLADRLSSADDTVRSEAEDEYAGLTLAQEYLEKIRESRNEERGLRNEMQEAAEDYRDGKMSRTDYTQFVEEAEKSLRENKIERIEAYRDLRTKMQQMMAGSIEAKKEFLEKEKTRIEEIHHLANSDMQGEDASPFKESTRMGRLANSSIVRFFAKPLITFDQMLRLFGQKNVVGEGYLFNKFHRGWLEATEKAYLGDMQAKSELDAKVSEVFDRDMRWSDLYKEERKMPTVTVRWWDGGQMRDHELTQGNLLYIYMVNKMTDGRMKLRRMGITEEHVEAIRRQMDERFIELADWLQGEYLVNKRNKYNAVHERLFGASMAAIEDYFPLKINKRSLNKDEDIGRPEFDDALPATTTGSIIKRRKNAQDLDLLGADAFSVVIEHIAQMEQWAAFAEFNKDLNTLLSYKRFRNQVQNMVSVYGSGRELWNNFRSVCRIAGGTYNPAGKKSDLDTAALNIAKGVTAAKISFRVYTALKQFLSMPAFISDANVKYLAENIATPWKSWNWAMENLPIFQKRWKSRQAGDTRLMKTESDWKLWRNEVVQKAAQWGMSPNAFVDALTVSIGSHSIYQTRYDRYIKDGYTPEKADKKAKQDATTLYNETQQSNEAAFTSPVQLDRTVLSTMLTVFRNSSMGYQRQLHDAIRNIGKMLSGGYKAETIEFMKKQMVRDGLTEEQAEHAANRNFNRETWRNAVRVATFGFLVQFAWNLGGSIAYLLFGDDDDKKEEMLKEAAIHGLIGGSMEGLAGGNVMSEALNMVAKGESLNNYDPSLLPIVSDIKSTYKKMSYDPVAGANDLVNLAVQAGIGVNPQTLTDAVVAVVDACGGDLDTSKEAMLLIMRVLQVPQSQIDQIYIDELGTNAAGAKKMSYGEMAERYARYKVAKGAPLTGWAYRDEAEEKREKAYLKRFKTMTKERKELSKPKKK